MPTLPAAACRSAPMQGGEKGKGREGERSSDRAQQQFVSAANMRGMASMQTACLRRLCDLRCQGCLCLPVHRAGEGRTQQAEATGQRAILKPSHTIQPSLTGVHCLEDSQVVPELPYQHVLLARPKPLWLTLDGAVKALQALTSDASVTQHTPVRVVVAVGLVVGWCVAVGWLGVGVRVTSNPGSGPNNDGQHSQFQSRFNTLPPCSTACQPNSTPCPPSLPYLQEGDVS